MGEGGGEFHRVAHDDFEQTLSLTSQRSAMETVCEHACHLKIETMLMLSENVPHSFFGQGNVAGSQISGQNKYCI